MRLVPPPVNASRRSLLLAGRVFVGLVSVLILLVTGIAYTHLRDLTQGLNTSNALGGDAPRSRDGATNILLIGLDSRKDQDGNPLPADILDKLHAGDGNEGGYNTNTLILMHVPNDDGKVTAFSIPRDDFVAVKGIPGYDHAKIKEAYGLTKFYTEQDLAKKGVTDQRALETQGREAGRKATIQTVRDFLGVPIDRFAEVNLAGFYDLATALDGVEVCLNQAVQDDYSGADFPAGHQTLNGAQALAFVRQRHGLDNGDLDRTHRQQAFLASVAHKLRSAGTFTDLDKLQKLIDVAKKDVVISSGWDVLSFAQQAQNLTGGKLEFATLPIESYAQRDGQDVNLVDVAKVQAMVRSAFGIASPSTSTTPPPKPSSTVDVYNATGTPGLAGKVADALVARGFVKGEVGNAGDAASGVTYGGTAKADADNAATLLGGLEVAAGTGLAAGHLRIALGPDFTMPAALLASPDATTTGPTTTAAPTSGRPATTESGPQGLPVDGSGIPCVN
ncbi:LCP family protein [Solihabitans fulvus]|uniref:LCP family protein n=1 Tax=Solihabitans fulvus TaxID=1892852 RepID=UPI001CB75DFB|nr:LCP family protein [Solihabitans fulvus]